MICEHQEFVDITYFLHFPFKRRIFVLSYKSLALDMLHVGADS